jgi:phosphoribosylformylglycinamidine synthase
VPRVDASAAVRIFSAVHAAISRGLVRSCHDLSEGGLAVAAAEMAFAGGWGIEIDLQPLAEAGGNDEDAVLLFSESNTRFLIEVPPQQANEFEATFAGLPVSRVGVVAKHDCVQVRDNSGALCIDSPLSELKAAWQQPLDWN